MQFVYWVDHEYSAYNAACYELGADLDLSDLSAVGYEEDEGYYAIVGVTGEGSSTSYHEFYGTLEGAGHTVNVDFDVELDAGASYAYGALFMIAEDATIRNLTVTGSVSSYGYTAGVVSSGRGCKFYNVRNEADITSKQGNYAYCGGIVGRADYGCTLVSCSNTGTVTAEHTYSFTSTSAAGYCTVAGLVGCVATGTTTKPSTADTLIEGCYNAGDITGNFTGQAASWATSPPARA